MQQRTGKLMSTSTKYAPDLGTAQPVLRRLIVYTLLFALVMIAAGGLSGLLRRLLDAGSVLVAEDVTGLALSLGNTFVGAPLAALLWWAAWRRLDTERSSIGWSLYVAAVYAVSLLVAFTSVTGTAAALIVGDTSGWAQGVARSLVWTGVLLWHRWMWRHPTRGPVELHDLPVVVGYAVGLVVFVGAAASALGTLFEEVIGGLLTEPALGSPWWRATVSLLVWAAGGAGLWWWHWMHDDGRRLRTGFSNVALVLLGVLAMGIITLGGLGLLLFVLLRLAVDRSEPLAALLEPLAPALAAASLGAPVWLYHLRAAARRSEGTRLAGRLVTSGVALAAAASGVGVIVNAVLAALASPVVGADPRTLLLGGISSLAVGGPVWWIAWRPAAEPADTERARRRVYLVAVFGLSAVVALITLLILGYLMFEFLLAGVGGGALLERVRAPLGLLLATGGTAAYHFSVWRHDRAVEPVRDPERTIGHVILVTARDPGELVPLIAHLTGARVTVWQRADAAPEASTPSAEELTHALDGVSAARVLVVLGAGIEVLPLVG